MNERRDALEVDAEALTARCDPASLPFDSTDELHAVEAVFGQERAVRAIEFALGMQARGYNLYASGPDGIGKSPIIESFLRRKAESLPSPPDWIYVHNFEDPDRPVGITLAAGNGRQFAEAMKRTVDRAAWSCSKPSTPTPTYGSARTSLRSRSSGERPCCRSCNKARRDSASRSR